MPADLTVDDDVTQSLARPPQDTLFTFPSVYVLGPSAKTTCWHANALLANVTKNCAPEAFQTGVNCDSPKCGRPADWPADRPFFLPFDLQDPAVWLRIGCARPVLDHVTEKEKKHLQARPPAPTGLLASHSFACVTGTARSPTPSRRPAPAAEALGVWSDFCC